MEGDDFLADDLLGLLQALGKRGQAWAWLCAGVEAYGAGAEALQACSDEGRRVGGDALMRMAAEVDSIADGYFSAYRDAETQPRLVVRVIDNQVFEMEAHDPAVELARQRRNRRARPVKAAEQSASAPGPAAGQPSKGAWNQAAYARQMRQGTAAVSAFFLIDSEAAFGRCLGWLAVLGPFGMPDMEGSQYFAEVRKIYAAGQTVINFDHDFALRWEGKDLPARLRCHTVDRGRYEVELWLPGLIADAVAERFSDGHEGFYCVFMPPLFYD